MSPDPLQEQKTPTARGLRSVGDELASLAAELSRTLRSDWMRAAAEEAPDSQAQERSTSVCIRYGQRLGELSLSTERAEVLVDNEVESLREASVRDSHSRLARLGSRAAFLLSTQLPTLMARRGLLAELLTSLSAGWLKVRGDRPFRWHRFFFYLIPAILVLGAEGALAEDITRNAFRLKGHFWVLFPIALLSLPLIFKEFLEWEQLKRLQKYYVGVLLTILLLLLVPLSWIRSNEVFRGGGRPASGPDPFAASSTPGAGLPTPGSPLEGATPRPKSQSKIVLLTSIFVMFGILFPMVSGLCFYRAWESADQGLESWRLRKELDRTRREVDAVDRQIGLCRTELDSNQHETIKLIANLSSGDRFVEKMIADLVGSLRGAGPEILARVKQQIESARSDGGWPVLAKQLALDVEALELSGDALHQAHVKFQKDLLSGIAQIEVGNSLARLAEGLKRRIRAALSEGHHVGSEAPFAVMAVHSPEEMVQLVRQRKLRDALFRGKRTTAPGLASER